MPSLEERHPAASGVDGKTLRSDGNIVDVVVDDFDQRPYTRHAERGEQHIAEHVATLELGAFSLGAEARFGRGLRHGLRARGRRAQQERQRSQRGRCLFAPATSLCATALVSSILSTRTALLSFLTALPPT